jgi:hypothetical protein
MGRLVQARDALLRNLPIYRQHVQQVFDRNSAIAQASLEASGKGVFFDSSKSIARVPYLFRRPEIELRIIHIVRDARAVA